MDIAARSNIKKQLMINFAVIMFFNIIINTAIFLVLDPGGKLLINMRGSRVVSTVVFLIAIILYHYKTNRFLGAVNGRIDNAGLKLSESNFIRDVNLLFCVPMLLATVPLTALSFLAGIIVNPFQLALFIARDMLIAMILTIFHYSRIKIILYPLSGIAGIKPLSIFEKLFVPIISSLMMLIMVFSFVIYAKNVRITMEAYKQNIVVSADKSVLALDKILGDIEIEMNSYMKMIDMTRITPSDGFRISRKLYEIRQNKNIETVVVVNSTGESYTHNGKKIDVNGRRYYQEMLSSQKTAWSDLLISKDTGNTIIACAIPYRYEGRVVAALILTINTTAIEEIIKKISSSDETSFFLINADGRIIYHSDRALMGKVLGADLVDKSGKDMKPFVNGNSSEFYNFHLHNEPVLVRKARLNSTGYYLGSMTNEVYVRNKLNSVIINIVFIMVLIIAVIYFIIYSIAKKFSRPIRNSILLFRKLSEGDLRSTIDDYSPDEFGDMINNIRQLQERIRDVIDSALNSSSQLASSAEELAATSSTLADSAQAQAAAVEEATASLEEISASNESIADNSKVQSYQAKETYRLIEELGKLIKNVNDDAVKTLKVANDTTNEAIRGNELMKNTISGMKSLDDNSRKIAEIVSLISDISDKVNLLALNAAIEAARAGEHGRGFAVVADEISKLAEQTADSAKSITGLVMNGVNAAKKGIAEIDQTSKALDNIIGYISSTKDLVQKIAHSTEVQAKAGEEVTKATRLVMEMSDSISNSTQEQTITHQEITKTMDQINTQTQQQASGAEEIASSAEEISAQAESMKNKLEFFKI